MILISTSLLVSSCYGETIGKSSSLSSSTDQKQESLQKEAIGLLKPIPHGRALLNPVLVNVGTAAGIEAGKQLARIASERAIVITIENRTSGTLNFPTAHFDSGTMDGNLPFEIRPGQAAVIPVTKKIGFVGVKGIISYRVKGKHDFVVFFENPYTGGNYHGAELYRNQHNSPYQNYKKIPKRKANVAHNLFGKDYTIYSMGTSGNNSKQIAVIKEIKKSGRRLVSVLPMEPVSELANSSKIVSLVSLYGTRLRASPDGNVDLSFNDSLWEKWTSNYLGNNQFTFKSAHGTFLRANSDGKVSLSPQTGDLETWTLESADGRNVWKSSYGTYLKAISNGKVGLSSSAEERNTWSY